MGVPAVGICAALDRVVRGPWDEPVAFVQRTYIDAVQRAGGLPLLLPPVDAGTRDPDLVLHRVEALLLAGGADVDPSAYGAKPGPHTAGTWPERDRFELALARRALDRGMPVLGVCRGMQVLNVARGGTLVQHLPDVAGHDDHRTRPGVFGEHNVRFEPGSAASVAIGAVRATVKSHHHQGVDELGDGVVATGWAVPDGTVEAIELPDQPAYALGVLWHPEEDTGSRVIESLVGAAQARVAA